MTDDDVRLLLVRAVEDIQGPRVDPAVWDRAQNVRRRRRLAVATGALAAAVCTGAGLAIGMGPLNQDDVLGIAQSQTPQPTVNREASIHLAPGPAANARLPLTRTSLRVLETLPRAARPLSQSPAAGPARAVVQRAPDVLLVLTVEGDWRSQRLDAATLGSAAAGAADGAGISPDGLRIAVPAGTALALIDVRTGNVSLQRPHGEGHDIQYVTWIDGRRLMAGGDAGQSHWTVGGPVVPTEFNAGDVVRGASMPLALETRDLLLLDAGQARRLPLQSPDALTVQAWYGPAVASGNDVARTAFVNDNDEQAVFVVDTRTGAVTSALRLPYENRGQGCCGVLGWLDESRVLFRDVDAVLAWRVGTDELQRIATFPWATHLSLTP